ncbi:unnamed protein product [Ilex paraguariensis]|uniref:RNase H type-1 domain-containing protein n=1 Tax=Ilex paraguariensis TaxID=185542 RepID=A0ABC8RDS1_9AQUA
METRVHQNQPGVTEHPSNRRPPILDQLKLNCDRAYNKLKNKAALGDIIRDEKGAVIDGKTKDIQPTSSRFSEVVAVREACLMACTMQLNNAGIESDNKEVILLSENEDDPPW